MDLNNCGLFKDVLNHVVKGVNIPSLNFHEHCRVHILAKKCCYDGR